MFSLLTKIFLLTIVFNHNVEGYYLDDSCRGAMKDNIKSAMAQNNKIATSALSSLTSMRKKFLDHDNAERDELSKLEEDTLARFVGTLIHDGRPQPDTDHWNFLTTTMAWIVEMTTPPIDEAASRSQGKDVWAAPGTPQLASQRSSGNNRLYGGLGRHSVVLFCDLSRFDAAEVPPSERNKDRPGQVLLDSRVGTWYHSNIIDRHISAPATAWTSPWGRRPMIPGETIRQPYHPATIQLNPDIMEVWAKTGVGGWNELVLDDIAPMLPWQGVSAAPKMAESMGFLLFHEMTHTLIGENGQTIRDRGGYSWKDCLASSQALGHISAQNIAYYAYTNYLLRNHDPPIKFSEEGEAQLLNEQEAGGAPTQS